MKAISTALLLLAATCICSAQTMDSGTGAPSSGVGNNGDLYHRTDVPSVYGPKTSGVWPSTFSYIVGQGCTTVYHIDQDCDGYGVGPTTITTDPNRLFGPDADDSDATVNTPASVLTKYGSINAFLTHLGYPTNRVFYIDPVKGVDASGCGTVPSPCQHFSYNAIGTVLNDGAGGTVMYRASTSAGLQICTGGGCYYPHASSPSSPVVIMAYPGEQVTFSATTAPLNGGGGSYNASTNVIFSGFSLIASSPGAGYGIVGSWVQNITLENSELAGWSMAVQFAAGSQNTTITQNLFHDVSEHAVYPVTGDQSQGAYSSGQFNCSTWRWQGNNTSYNPHINFSTTNNVMLYVGSGGYDAIHYNGQICGGLVSGNVLVDGGGSAITLQDGNQNVTISNNIIANNSASGITVNIYGCDNNGSAYTSGQVGTSCDSSYTGGSVAYYPNMESGNKIINNTVWTGLNAPSSFFCAPACAVGYYGINISDTSEGVPGGRWVKNTTIQNNLLVTFNGNGGGVYPQLWFGRNSYPETNTLANNLLWNAYPGNSSTDVMQIASNSLSCSSAPWYCAGSTTGTYGSGSAYPGTFSFSQFQSYNTGSNTNELWGNPTFADVQTGYSTTPNMFNFRLLSGSPALGAGLASGAPSTDVTGVTRASTPSIGAYEYMAVTALTSLACTPTVLTAGTSITCTVTLPKAAAGGAVITISSTSAAVVVPVSVTISAGASSATFTVTVGAGSPGQAVVLSAAFSGATLTTSLIFPAPVTLKSLACTPSSIASGAASTCNLTLSQPAGSGGITVNLSSNMAPATVPATVSVAVGSATAQFSATAGTVSSIQNATISAQYSGASLSATVSVQPPTSTGTGAPIGTGSWIMVPTHGFPVQTVGYEKVVYAPAPVKKVVMLGNYHEMSSEPETSLIAYDFQSNRWNVLDIGGLFHTENMPEAGHSVGAFSYDPNLNTLVYYCCASGSNQPENPYSTWWYDPIGQTGRNKQTSPKPGAVLYESSTFDSLNNTYVIDGGTSFEGTWTYNPTTNLYQQQTTLGTPPNPSVWQAAMTYDTSNHLVYLFGGNLSSSYSNGLYSYNVATNTWTQLNPSGPPPAPRWRAALAYDSTNNVFMMYGGQDATNIYNDTWIYDPTANSWTQLNPAQSPGTPTSAAFERLAYDSDDNVFVLVAPGTGGYLDGTWSSYPAQTWMFRYQGTGPNPGSVLLTPGPTPNSINENSNDWAKDPSLAASGSTLLTAWVETGSEFETSNATWFHVYSAQQSGSGWTALGGLPASVDSEFSNYSESYAPSIAVVSGTPWISWYKWNNSTAPAAALYAKSWNGTSWVGGVVGNVGNNSYQGPSQMADVAGVPFVAFIEVEKAFYPQKTFAYVKYWNGKAWTLKGTGPLNVNASSNTTAGSISIASNGTNPYVAWTEYSVANAALQAETNPQVYVAHWTGSQWVNVGGSLNVNPSGWADSAFIAYAGGQPFVAWTERSAAGSAQLFVKTFNGTNWVPVGSGPLNINTNTGWAFHPSLAVDPTSGKLYVGWVEQAAIGQPSQTYVSVLSNGAWSPLGGSLNADPSGSAQRISIAVAGGQPAAAWGEVKLGSLRQVFVKQWNGTSWNLAGAATTPPSACDLNSDGVINAVDVQLAINQALGLASCTNADLQNNGQCTVVDVQRIINASLGGACVTGQ